ncbi:MAG: NAAT family transporter [Lentimicrobiaceae bacterium]|jgi:multiple antibiotic resistance protein|nr:NAAT family transporter [Lentimicrobiaceae bacterium]MCP4909553.1 NAAT family transporter [Bacteroidota bacterium]MBT3453463.1 NAAT family transporter [Lentimicrobiaceae bacterium]MBT3818998.1 NAAT family transporter [Lentimicrobiaceae bacterium]MBT4060473.1 NAAT family transporter [Lentimicrobiaceae bacterium]
MDTFTTILLYFTSFFTLMNPMGIMPVFLTMTSELSKKERRRTAIKATVTATLILMMFAFLGEYLFTFFGISVSGLQVVGGVLFFIMGYDMLNARLSPIKITAEEVDKYVDDISITPLGIPMIAGPGAITNAIILMGESKSIADSTLVLGSILLVSVVLMLVLISAVGITKFLGEKGNKIMMKLMGLIVMVIAVEFFFAGIKPYIQDIMNM